MHGIEMYTLFRNPHVARVAFIDFGKAYANERAHRDVY